MSGEDQALGLSSLPSHVHYLKAGLDTEQTGLEQRLLYGTPVTMPQCRPCVPFCILQGIYITFMKEKLYALIKEKKYTLTMKNKNIMKAFFSV